MVFTPLHQALGAQPGPLTSEMLDEAIAVGVTESDTLDWKQSLPEERALAQSDVIKDIAAFANSGGGMLVFGVAEEQKAAIGRIDIGEVNESYERTLRRVCVSGIQPPIFGLDVIRLGEEGNRALAVVIPPSPDAPHLIYRNEYFGAPIRNHADTEWMRERTLEGLYRQRFEARQGSTAALDDLYAEQVAGKNIDQWAWLFIVARPRIQSTTRRLDQPEVVGVVRDAVPLALGWAKRDAGPHPLEAVDRFNPRRGLRRWVLMNQMHEERSWLESWFAMHDSGAVTMAQAIGGHYVNGGFGTEQLGDQQIRSRNLECSIADFMALLRSATRAMGMGGEYDLVLGIESDGRHPIQIETVDSHGFRYSDTSIPLARYTPIKTAVLLDVDDDGFTAQVHALALDAVNQGGVQQVQLIPKPEERG